MSPATLASGKSIVRVVNNGQQVHEMGVLRLLGGITPDQALEILSTPPGEGGPPPGPPPFAAAGGFQAIMPGQQGWALLDLQPGEYAMVCFVHDPATGVPHIAFGMFTPFKVQ